MACRRREKNLADTVPWSRGWAVGSSRGLTSATGSRCARSSTKKWPSSVAWHLSADAGVSTMVAGSEGIPDETWSTRSTVTKCRSNPAGVSLAATPSGNSVNPIPARSPARLAGPRRPHSEDEPPVLEGCAPAHCHRRPRPASALRLSLRDLSGDHGSASESRTRAAGLTRRPPSRRRCLRRVAIGSRASNDRSRPDKANSASRPSEARRSPPASDSRSSGRCPPPEHGATVPILACSSLRYSHSRSSRSFRPRCPPRTGRRADAMLQKRSLIASGPTVSCVRDRGRAWDRLPGRRRRTSCRSPLAPLA